MKRLVLWSGLFLFAVSCLAQKNEVDMVLGNTWSYNSHTTITGTGFPPFTLGSGRNSHLTYEVGLARQLASFRPAALSLELTAAGFPANGEFASVFVVPAARFSFLPRNRISPFATTGVGFVHLAKAGFPSSNGVAYQFGGGVDVKSPVPFLSFRAEVRDFLASQSGSALVPPSTAGLTVRSSFRNHVLAGGGLVLRF